MPLLYVFSGAELSDALRRDGRAIDARAVMALTSDVARTAGFPDLVRALQQQATQPQAGDSSGFALPVVPPKVQSTEPVTRKK
jgi:hypothetical protein